MIRPLHHEGIVNHFAGLKLQRVKEVNARCGYTSAEKQRLIQWAKEQEPYRKWIALLGLYTGARANEICQLYADDVQQVDEVWCLNIRDNRPDQKLKTANSARLIPIHSSLIAGGFIYFVQERAGGRLFPELPHRQDGYSHLWGQWFSRHRPVDKDFHSLRHTSKDVLNVVPMSMALVLWKVRGIFECLSSQTSTQRHGLKCLSTSHPTFLLSPFFAALRRGLPQSLRLQGRVVIMGSSIALIATPLHVDYLGRVSCYILTLEILLMALSSIPKCLIYLGSH